MQGRLQLGEGFLKRRKIWGRTGQKEKLTAASFDDASHLSSLLDAQIIHHHDLSSRQTGREDLLHIDLKSCAIGCSIYR